MGLRSLALGPKGLRMLVLSHSGKPVWVLGVLGLIYGYVRVTA